ncbi:hypothetical protein ebB185 [Aromatoleum aromaticum EbN1]|uniref:Uncharacterized protein n=1 Tax=Aromatoleum aromaticum (strain DSM 19018 / LMG 30748 / EbN1) TaxID=76114 RepID=Q5P0Q6_AROAE|nr:hypothetical protein ebB185 [Aromatoleum aromaticum EbN1]
MLRRPIRPRTNAERVLTHAQRRGPPSRCRKRPSGPGAAWPACAIRPARRRGQAGVRRRHALRRRSRSDLLLSAADRAGRIRRARQRKLSLHAPAQPPRAARIN